MGMGNHAVGRPLSRADRLRRRRTMVLSACRDSSEYELGVTTRSHSFLLESAGSSASPQTG
jgi:hypothetical protein